MTPFPANKIRRSHRNLCQNGKTGSATCHRLDG
jgi:hypothetical protein